MRGKTPGTLALGALSGAAALLATSRWVNSERRWGSTDEEVTRFMPGDNLVARPRYFTTRAITVEAPPESIFPWLKQMGFRRGGLYSYDFLDRLFGFLDAPSGRQVLPAFQELREGDTIPIGRGEPLPVAELIENEALVLGDAEAGWSWSTCLYPQSDGTTRLVTRNRGRISGWFGATIVFAVDIAAFIMVRRWLTVLKQRAEALSRQTAARDLHPVESRLLRFHRRG